MIISNSAKTWVVWLVVTIGSMVGMFAMYTAYNHGLEVARLKCAENNSIAIQTAIEKAKIEWEANREITDRGMKNVTDAKEQIKIIERRVETIVSPNCSDVGADFGRVYNATIQAIKHANRSGHNATTKVSDTPTD